MSVSIADLKLLTERLKSRLLIPAGADGEAVRGAMKKRRRKLAFSCVQMPAATRHPCGNYSIFSLP